MMDHPPDFGKLVTLTKNIVWTDDFSTEDAKKLSGYLDSLLAAENGVRLLMQNAKDFEVILFYFVRIIFHSDRDVARPCLKHCDTILEIFRKTLPKIKASYKDFEKNTLLGLVESLRKRVEANDDLWTSIWIFVCNLLTSDSLQAPSLNKLLNITELAFKNKSKDRPEIIEKAWLCWRGLIKAFGRNPKCININRTMNLLMRPLLNLSSTSKSQISTWVLLIEAKGLSGTEEIVKSVIGSMCKMMFKSGERSLCRHSPDECTEALLKILPHEHVLAHCFPDVIEVFGACVNSRPSASLIEQFTGLLIQTINDLKDVGASFKLWKTLLEQYNACTESPILSQACQNIFTDVNFLRWVDSSTVESKDIVALMHIAEFRDKVLLPSIKALTFDEQSDTPTTKKSRKGSCEDVWSNYCEAYITWWSNQLSPLTKENDKPEAIQCLKDDSDYHAVQALLLHPIVLNMWNPTVCKTWSLLCATCHNKKFLQTIVKNIFDAVCEPHFHVQKAIDVSDCIYRLDIDFCKLSINVLETLSSAIFSMDFQCLLDLLNLVESAMIFPEMSESVDQVCKYATLRSTDYDQLNAHKIKTKVTKITRKVEHISNSAEKEKPTKAQRAPFRAQSNFLQRLAKAEEKNKTKNPFLTSMFQSSEKLKNGVEVVIDQSNFDMLTQENGGFNTSVESNTGPTVTSPSALEDAPGHANGQTEEVDKEMVLPAVNGPLPEVSPKMKITNAREVKSVDASSAAAAKKSKLIAGLKTTPKKLTPSKVSYFDDDAHDCVMVPPQTRTTPLTEHQMEMLSKRRTDIPALYQDLSQDTQSQQVIIEEVTTGVSPKPIQESQDFVPGTPSPEDRAITTTPERRKGAGKTTTSAKKLDFNHFGTPPSKTSLMSESLHEICINEDCLQLSNGIISSQPLEAKEEKPMVNGQSSSEQAVSDPIDTEDAKQESRPAPGERSKRKRKSEPSKFSPKLTRSKKNLKNVTPDAKLTNLPEPDAKSLFETGGHQTPVANEEEATLGVTPERGIPQSCLESSNKGSKKVADDEPIAADAKNSETVLKINGLQEGLEGSQLPEEVLPSSQTCSQEKVKKARKRKVTDSTHTESPKKVKTCEDEPPCGLKKGDSAKKRKPFKLGVGGNLENWLVKTQKVPTPLPETVIADEVDAKPKQNGFSVELDSSDEIVPSTQEIVQNTTPISPVSERKTDEGSEDVKVEIGKEDVLIVPAVANSKSPEKPEGSVLERLSHESPNDDIDLIISPSKRQRRAPSVFRGEGDTYLGKDKFYSTPSEELDDDSKSARPKCKPTSPTTKKRLHPLGGRSAKMLRLATSSVGSNLDEDKDDIVVTPIRRRESIAPVKYGESWPKGHTEEWVACTPGSPFASPFRSALKRTPGPEEHSTPLKARTDSMVSPLLSSTRRKRVAFLDPPVTQGLLYEVDSPGGSIHHADVPHGSPYPTWRGDEEPVKIEISDEVRQLISPTESTIVPIPAPNIDELKEKFDLSAAFMEEFLETDAHLQSLITRCFLCVNMQNTVGDFTFNDCILINRLRKSFLESVRNINGENILDAFNDFSQRPVSTECSAQTDQPVVTDNCSQTIPPVVGNSSCQTNITTFRSVDTNTDTTTASSSTQADFRLPFADELPSIVEKLSPADFGHFITNFAKIWANSQSKRQ